MHAEGETAQATDIERRPLMIGLLSIVSGAVALLVPLASGLVTFLSPLWRHGSAQAKSIRVTTLDAIPADGLPRRFQVIDSRQDKWNRYPPAPIGAVYLQRFSDGELKAYSATCPHLGCLVDFKESVHQFKCPCHNSSWTVEAERIDPEHCPSPRDLDPLPVETRNDSEVWIEFMRFRSGKSERIAE